ncbi:hypothetical protein [Hymenobacter sp. YC55]|uniref:hypothetical protein n=1 Tax=Hymenobacter sp. YC55 TaxID=3034019 RepID=UPI0023F8CE25|nr:hypothetical protein [Hymenobacter sp. YC55]
MPEYSLCNSTITDSDKSRELRRWSALHQMPYCLSQQELLKFRPWHIINLTGSYWHDEFAYRLATITANNLNAASNHDAGMSIVLPNHANYSQLVKVLDWAENIHLKMYWLDIRHQPITLYAITSKPLPNLITIANSDNELPSGPDVFYDKLSATQQFFSWITALFSPTNYLPLFQPDWRNTTLLLLLIAALSVIRLYRQHRTG